ncbi:hypothetical protein C7999DRAFT_17032 [Corynascus novoguineensis]|uniref:Uncharacterized protein n=1 Tax=Corynascus novoguineensis TaxID=1126955 RepID=A0AAN7CM95_9PEZI|nr:hypothetical protein C7999DRAFT_17032 [Corynascus novoguineensis]
MVHSSSSAGHTPYSTHGEVRYLERLELYKTEKPYEVTFAPINITQPGVRRTNLSRKARPVVIRDFSTKRDSFSTDVQGFELDSFPTSLSTSELRDTGAIETRYHREAEAYLTRKYEAKKIFIFDTTIREAREVASLPQDASVVLKNKQKMRPAGDCHVDQSSGSVRRRIMHNFPDQGESLISNHRVRVINIWRPLVWPYHSHPLAVCDWRSTVMTDYALADHTTPVWEGESLQVHHNPAHQWWFAKRMDKDDVLLLKMYDSEAEKQSSGTPHCSFDWKDEVVSAAPRVSMEIRAIVFS